MVRACGQSFEELIHWLMMLNKKAYQRFIELQMRCGERIIAEPLPISVGAYG